MANYAIVFKKSVATDLKAIASNTCIEFSPESKSSLKTPFLMPLSAYPDARPTGFVRGCIGSSTKSLTTRSWSSFIQ